MLFAWPTRIYVARWTQFLSSSLHLVPHSFAAHGMEENVMSCQVKIATLGLGLTVRTTTLFLSQVHKQHLQRERKEQQVRGRSVSHCNVLLLKYCKDTACKRRS